jgi:uncharacterized protein (TIGR02466 family)
MHIESKFPVLIGTHQVDSAVVEKTLLAVRQWETTDSYKKYMQYRKDENLNTTYHTYHDILSEIKLIDLRNEINNAIREFAAAHGTKIENASIHSWINYFEPGNYEERHDHYGNIISGVYYVQAMPNTGNFEYYEPAKQKCMWNALYTNIRNVSEVQPKTGKMILFPSYLEHCVKRNVSSSTRISIAFNIPTEK